MTTLQSRFIQDSVIEIGIDEAGRGSFWGPIMAGAVILPNESDWTEDQRALFQLLRDSKKISPVKRGKMEVLIKKHIPLFSVGIVDASEINEKGITWANQEAFRRAVQLIPLPPDTPYRLLIDGTLPIHDWNGQQENIIEGDNQYMAIAAASILAKVGHDQWIQDYITEHPECEERYHLSSSKGYGTAKHRDGIRIYGAHELHRNIYIQHWLPGTVRPVKVLKQKKDECLIRLSGI